MTGHEAKAREIVGGYSRVIDGEAEEAVVDAIAQALREAEARGMERAAEIADRLDGFCEAANCRGNTEIAASIRAAKEKL